MSRTKIIALGFLAIVVPAALAFTAYLVSRSTIGSAGTVPSLTHSSTENANPEAPPTPTGDDKQGAGGTSPSPQVTASPRDDHGGKCSEPEHSADPSCGSGDSSGKGSGDTSPNRGHGGGDD